MFTSKERVEVKSYALNIKQNINKDSMALTRKDKSPSSCEGYKRGYTWIVRPS